MMMLIAQVEASILYLSIYFISDFTLKQFRTILDRGHGILLKNVFKLKQPSPS